MATFATGERKIRMRNGSMGWAQLLAFGWAIGFGVLLLVRCLRSMIMRLVQAG